MSKFVLGFKNLYKDMTCQGFKFELGKRYKIEGTLKICQNGFHFHRNPLDLFSYYKKDLNEVIVCKIKAHGKIIDQVDKSVTSEIELVEVLSKDEVKVLCNLVNNIGWHNSGDYNSGSYNSGNNNSGNYNSGNCNSGVYNSGNYNSGDCNSGFFNTTEPTMRLFNKDTNLLRPELAIPYVYLPVSDWINESDMTAKQKKANPNYETAGGIIVTRTYHEAWKIAWKRLDNRTKQQFLDLPNFDKAIFKEITGITVKKSYKD